jgi:hypothetical protein
MGPGQSRTDHEIQMNKERISTINMDQILGLVLSSVVLGLTTASVLALDSNQPPSGNFDLRPWKLTLPTTNASEIAGGQLESGFSDPSYFYTAPDGAMVFWCPVTGGLTRGATYPRCELRELLDPDHENVNWTGYGTNVLRAQCRVMQVPSGKKVVIGQIHSYTGNAYPLLKLQFNNGRIEALVKESPAVNRDTLFAFANVGLSNLITYQIKFVDGLLSMTVNGSNQLVNVFQTDPAWMNQSFYFRAGNYCLDNSGSTNEGSLVAFYQLSVEHNVPAIPAQRITITNVAKNAAGQFSLTLLGENAGSYFIQTSTNQTSWSYLLITNSISGRIDFTDTSTGDHAIRFYRGGAL